MYQATVNNSKFEIILGEEGLSVDGELIDWNIAKIADGQFHVLHENKSYRLAVIKSDPTTKTCVVKINGKLLEIKLKDKFDLLLEKMGLTAASASKANLLRAPMPGLILALKVKEGDIVKQNDPLIVLEAMKMENIIKATGEGQVKSVKIKKGDSVEKNQILIEF